MTRLIKGGAHGKVVIVLPGETAQRRKAFPLIQRVRLLQHLGTARLDDIADGALFIARRHIFQRQGRDQDQAVILSVKKIHRPGAVFRAPKRIQIVRHAQRHIQRAAVVRTENQRFGFTARFFQIVNVGTQTRLLQAGRGHAARGAGRQILINLPGGETIGINAFLHRMGDIRHRIAFLHQPGINRVMHHKAQRQQQQQDKHDEETRNVAGG